MYDIVFSLPLPHFTLPAIAASNQYPPARLIACSHIPSETKCTTFTFRSQKEIAPATRRRPTLHGSALPPHGKAATQSGNFFSPPRRGRIPRRDRDLACPYRHRIFPNHTAPHRPNGRHPYIPPSPSSPTQAFPARRSDTPRTPLLRAAHTDLSSPHRTPARRHTHPLPRPRPAPVPRSRVRVSGLASAFWILASAHIRLAHRSRFAIPSSYSYPEGHARSLFTGPCALPLDRRDQPHPQRG